MIALVDGRPASSIPVSDSSVLRGDGCFEAVRSYGGRLFALAEHLDRLDRSAAMLGIGLPARSQLENWARQLAAEGGEGIVRIVVTRGDVVPGGDPTPRCLVLHHPLAAHSEAVRLLPVPAPWHPAGRDWELAGAKTLSYAPNLAAGRLGQQRGYDDAVLVSEEGVVLEGPTFTVAWVDDEVVETPQLGLHILESISRRHLLAVAAELGVEVREGTFPLARMQQADEVMAVSTQKEVTPVVALGAVDIPAGPLTAKLRAAFQQRVARLLDQGG